MEAAYLLVDDFHLSTMFIQRSKSNHDLDTILVVIGVVRIYVPNIRPNILPGEEASFTHPSCSRKHP